jgi:hypothetical protein
LGTEVWRDESQGDEVNEGFELMEARDRIGSVIGFS